MTTVHTIANMKGADTDSRVFFRRPDNSIYAILQPATLRQMRKQHCLERFLKRERNSGVVIKIAKA